MSKIVQRMVRNEAILDQRHNLLPEEDTHTRVRAPTSKQMCALVSYGKLKM